MNKRRILKISGVIFTYMLVMSSSIMAQDSSSVPSIQDTIPPGVQGAINPLTDNTKVQTGDELLDSSFPNSWPIFGTNIRMAIGGYAKADFIQDFDYIADPFEFELGSIAVEGNPDRDLGGASNFHVKESRINFDLRSKAKRSNGEEFPMQVFIEIDWFFDSPTMALNTRLRHAYGVIGRLLVGRSWNTSSDLSAIPGLIDFSGGDGLYGARVEQIKWMDKINDNFKYAIAVEANSAQIANPENYEGASRPPWPALAGMIKYYADQGSTVQLGADVFPVKWNGSSVSGNTQKIGYIANLMSRIVFSSAGYYDAILVGGGYGSGQAHRIIALSWDGKASGVITPNGLELANSWYAYFGINHYWNKNFNSTIATYWTGTDLSPYQTNNTIKRAGSFHVNFIWFPYKLVSTGIEYMWGMRENKDGAQGTASRIQFMAKFKFN